MLHGKVNAIGGDRLVMLDWVFTQTIAECLGVTIRRRKVDAGNQNPWVPLESWVSFEDPAANGSASNPAAVESKTTDEWPIQKTSWIDYGVENGTVYAYEIIPMCGKPGQLVPRNELKLQTGNVTPTSQHGDVGFATNNGIIAAQWVARAVQKMSGGYPELVKAMQTPGHPMRNRLMGNVYDEMAKLIVRARNEGGHCYLALYELNDPALCGLIEANKDRISLILGNAGENDGTNAYVRQHLHDIGMDIHDRMLEESEIPHNKLIVYVDAQGKPKAYLLSTTNWTWSGLCAQVNCAGVIESEELAAYVFDYWKRLLADNAKQSAEFRAANAKLHPPVKLKGNATAQLLLSPCMQDRIKPKDNPPEPPGIAAMRKEILGAKKSVSLLAFYPGNPSVLNTVIEVSKSNPDLIVQAAVSSPEAVPRGVQLYRHGQPPIIISAAAIEEQIGKFIKEELKADPRAHAIIHAKMWVVDPDSPTDCAVGWGSDNMGYKAEYQNDENFCIIKGNQALALAAAAFIRSVIDPYVWRSVAAQHKNDFKGYLSASDDWQNKYYDVNTPSYKKAQYWAGIKLVA